MMQWSCTSVANVVMDRAALWSFGFREGERRALIERARFIDGVVEEICGVENIRANWRVFETKRYQDDNYRFGSSESA
jgi:hypothetical protein